MMVRALSFERPLIMGIINVTPDSFAGDGLLINPNYVEAALRQASHMIADGADILDVGGESSRPGSLAISGDEELRRVVPVVEALRKEFNSALLSVDTVKAEVARAALGAGADIINDISALSQDPAMASVVAVAKAWVVLMHNRSQLQAVTTDNKLGNAYHAASYQDFIPDVLNDLEKSIELAQKAGVEKDKIIVDPGIGFGKSVEQNLSLINYLDHLKALGCPLLLGASRKNFIGRVLDTSPKDRLEGTAAVIAIAVSRGANILRVHDVKFMARVVKMANAIMKSATTGTGAGPDSE